MGIELTILPRPASGINDFTFVFLMIYDITNAETHNGEGWRILRYIGVICHLRQTVHCESTYDHTGNDNNITITSR